MNNLTSSDLEKAGVFTYDPQTEFRRCVCGHEVSFKRVWNTFERHLVQCQQALARLAQWEMER